MQSNSDGLIRRAPSELGVEPAAIRRFCAAVEAEGLELHSFMFWKSGAVIAEAWWAPYAPDFRHTMHSVTKSFVATAIGFAHDAGLLSLETPVVEFFPEHIPPDADPRLARMTVRHLLTMTSGHASGISGGEWRRLTSSWIGAFLAEPMAFEPGERFVYCSGCSYMLAAILQRVTGMSLTDWLAPRLFAPLGIRDLEWDISPEGVNTGGNGITARTQDLLKLTLLHLHGGCWQGRRLLSREWVAAATGMQVANIVLGAFDGKRYAEPGAADLAGTDRREGYGFQWWRGPWNTFSANGLFGQYAIAFPDHDAAFVFTGATRAGERAVHALVWRHLLSALRAGTPGPDRAADAGLADYLAQRRIATLPVLPVPPARARFAGQWHMAPNPEGVTAIALHCADGLCRFELRDGRGQHAITAGLAGWHDGVTGMTGWQLHHSYQPASTRVLARAVWETPERLVMDWAFIETTFRDRVELHFDTGGGLRFLRRVNTNSTLTEMPMLRGQRAVEDAQ